MLASACLPFMFQAVEIDGEHYWDGGYMGNPAIFPLIYDCEQPRRGDRAHQSASSGPEVPTTAREIMNRINEISFNSSLMREMRAIAFVTQADRRRPARGRQQAQAHADPRHRRRRRDAGSRRRSKLNADWEFLLHLHDVGRERAQAWLDGDFALVGKDSSVDIRNKYL